MGSKRQTARKSTGGQPPRIINSKTKSANLKTETLGKQAQPPSLRKPRYQSVLPQDVDKSCDASGKLELASSSSPFVNATSTTPTRRWTQTARKSTGRKPPNAMMASVHNSKDSLADTNRADSPDPELSRVSTLVAIPPLPRREIRRFSQTARKSTGGRPPRAKTPVTDSGSSKS